VLKTCLKTYLRRLTMSVGALLIGEVKELLVPATPQQIIQTLGVLQHAYPGFAGHSRIFDHFAVDDLVIMRPSLIALVGGCRWLRQNSPEAPSVAQLLAAVECCERFWLRGWNALEHGYAARVQALADGAQVPATPTLH